MAMTIDQFGQAIKRKYPQYRDIPDAELGKKMLAKYPQYSDMVGVGDIQTAPGQTTPETTGAKQTEKVQKEQPERNGTEEKIPGKPLAVPPGAGSKKPAENIVGNPAKIVSNHEDFPSEDSIWKPGSKPGNIAGKTEPVDNTKTAPEAKSSKIEESLSKTVSFYREQIESSGATKIRALPIAPAKEEIIAPKNQEKTPEKNNENALDNGETIKKPKINDPAAEAERPSARILESRWEQIKKSSSPAPGATPTAAPPKASLAMPEQLKPTGKNKILARALVIVALIGIIGIILAVVLTKNNTPTIIKKTTGGNSTTTTTGKKIDTTEPTAENNKKNNGESPYMATVSTIPIYTEDLASVPNLLSPYLQTSLGSTGYYQVSIVDKKNNSKIGLKQFFNIYKINAPEIFYSSVSDDFTLFIYSNNGKNRLGFVTSAGNAESLETAMEGWEGSLRTDTDNLFKLLGRKTQDPEKELRFKTEDSTGGTEYRSMVFLPETDNFSINWAIYNDKYFIFATSADTLKKTFDQLPK
ncbi:MAG: hypothetical protein WA093_03000 [Minisyncoccales bacterium]